MENTKMPEIRTDIVGCQFVYKTAGNRSNEMGSKTYYYKLVPGVTVSVGDTVVVSCSTGFQVVEVVEVNVLLDDFSFKDVVARVDMEAYRSYKARQKEMARMEAELQARKESLLAEELYELLAEKDPAFKGLLKQYKAMGGVIK